MRQSNRSLTAGIDMAADACPKATVEEGDRVLAGVTAAQLLERRTIQGCDVTVWKPSIMSSNTSPCTRVRSSC
jgi:hypothetical protein